MAKAAESQYPREWFHVAAKDFRRVSKRLAEEDTDDAAFHLQQALEKYLKGFLLLHGWSLNRIHDLNVLLTDAVHYEPELERYRALCQQVTNWYVVERYPTFEEGPLKSEVVEASTQAKVLVRHLKAQASKTRH